MDEYRRCRFSGVPQKMTLHYHGLPLTPNGMLIDLAGRNVCISFATKSDYQVELSLRKMQSIMFDNGAFSIYRNGGTLDVNAYYRWLEPMLGHPHWAVVPDVIGGDENAQRHLIKTWPFPKELGAPVWHLGLSLDYLFELIDNWPTVCLGSSGDYWQVGGPDWSRRMDDVTLAIFRRSRFAPRLHGLRMLSQAGKRWPLASVDSVNIARNFKDREETPSFMAQRIDAVNNPTRMTTDHAKAILCL